MHFTDVGNLTPIYTTITPQNGIISANSHHKIVFRTMVYRKQLSWNEHIAVCGFVY